MKQSKLPKQTLIILGIALVLVISTVMWSSAQITQDTEEEVQSTLRDVATQNALIVQQEIRENFNLLYSLADAISVSPGTANASSITAQLESFVSTYGFKRIGFISPDGQAVATDGYVQDLSSRDFFKEGMQGLPGITNTLQDRMGTPEPINVFSIPVYDQSDSIIGVLFATYRNQHFKEILGVQSFNNQGFSCLVNQDDDLIAASSNAPASLQEADRMSDYLTQNTRNDQPLQDLHTLLQSSSSNGGYFYEGSQKYYYYAAAMDNLRSDRQWFVLTIVPDQVLSSRSAPILFQVRLLILLIIVIAGGGAFAFVHSIRIQRRQLYRLAYVDPLTNGDNFACFKEKLSHRSGDCGFYVALDLQDFKLINNTCGVAKGDETLSEVWNLLQTGWAEQDPESWWENLKLSTQAIMTESGVSAAEIKAIGISYQMHGLVCVDKNQHVLRPAIIWCDSRAVPYGQKAFETIGEERCLSHLLNSPGNFTASKLAWIKENEPAIYEQIDKIMLPGDYIAMKLSGEICTTVSGLSEGMFWDFKNNRVADFLMDYYGFDSSLIADIKPTFAEQGRVNAIAAKELGLKEGTPITYRAGDQPNNALSLNVFNPGEIASTAGTSGVVYGVNGEVNYDPQSRVNTFAHVNHTIDQTRLGVLLCINGTGILNSWVKRNIAPEGISYNEMNVLASKAPIGSAGISILPFGNGAERMLNNKEIGCSIRGLDFNTHGKHHIIRAAQEGIVFSFKYGIDIMEQMGIPVKMIHAGHANMFLSSIFRDTLAGVTGATIELYDTDGSVGAAKGAGIGAGIYKDNNEAFATLDKLDVIEPNVAKRQEYADAYAKWKYRLEKSMTGNIPAPVLSSDK